MARRDPFLSRVVGALFVCGGILIVISLLLRHPGASNSSAIREIAVLAFLVGAACLAAARRIPMWLIQVTVAGSSVLICLCIYYTGVAAGLYSTMFIWVVLVSAYFFSPKVALAQSA